MEITTIIVIVIFSICGLVLLWAIANGNNIKIKKKEKKSKKKQSKEEKFKDIVPKEKKEKKSLKQKISNSAKEEKSGAKELPSNKVTKVTKEDFKSNDLEVPKALDDTKTESKEKPAQEEFKFDVEDFNITGDPTSKLIGDINFGDPIAKMDNLSPNFDGIDDNLFLPPMYGEDDKFSNLFKNNMADTDYKFDDELSPLNFDDKDLYYEFKAPETKSSREPGQVLNETLEERFNKVFSENPAAISAMKEVIVGDVMNGNRARTNRAIRERRLNKVVPGLGTEKDN